MPTGPSNFWSSCACVSNFAWLPAIKQLCVIYQVVGQSVKSLFNYLPSKFRSQYLSLLAPYDG